MGQVVLRLTHQIIALAIIQKIPWLVVWNMNFTFPYIGNVIIPTDFHIFQWVETTNQTKLTCSCGCKSAACWLNNLGQYRLLNQIDTVSNLTGNQRLGQIMFTFAGWIPLLANQRLETSWNVRLTEVLRVSSHPVFSLISPFSKTEDL